MYHEINKKENKVIPMRGILYGIGAGPGDPRLLTIKAVEILRTCDAVITPRKGIRGESTAYSIVRQYLGAGCRVIPQVFPMVDDQEEKEKAWQENKNQILELVLQGLKVGFVTLGDPMIYSTFSYIYALLKDEPITIEIIPGITSFCECAAKTGTVLAEGDEVLRIIPAAGDTRSLDQAFQSGDSLVLMKVSRHLEKILAAIQKTRYAEKALLVSRSGLDNEQVIRDLSRQAPGGKVNYLSTILARK
jgi:precorrin-2/cobalt-factor-2 C20-methyltransferase